MLLSPTLPGVAANNHFIEDPVVGGWMTTQPRRQRRADRERAGRGGGLPDQTELSLDAQKSRKTPPLLTIGKFQKTNKFKGLQKVAKVRYYPFAFFSAVLRRSHHLSAARNS
jgi:hypothetical protein